MDFMLSGVMNEFYPDRCLYRPAVYKGFRLVTLLFGEFFNLQKTYIIRAFNNFSV